MKNDDDDRPPEWRALIEELRAKADRDDPARRGVAQSRGPVAPTRRGTEAEGLVMWLLDAWLSDWRWWRRWRGGVWWHWYDDGADGFSALRLWVRSDDKAWATFAGEPYLLGVEDWRRWAKERRRRRDPDRRI